MSNSRYLEIDSTYRDRTRFPTPAEFEIPISQNGRKGINDAVDPVSLGIPIFAWSGNNLSTSTSNVSKLVGTVEPKTTALSGSNDTVNFLFNSTNVSMHQLKNYYIGLIIEDSAFFNRRHITSSTFLGSFTNHDRTKLTISSAMPETWVSGNDCVIYDPTDFSNTQYPVIWVPDAYTLANSYPNYYLYNETQNDYRVINYYDNAINCITSLVGTDINPVSNWSATDNYCIRQELPFLPILLGTNPIIDSSTFSTITLNEDISDGGKIDVTYKFIRILAITYNYPLQDADGQSSRIIKYNASTKTVTVFPPFTGLPTVGNQIEICNFSYDNLNAFNYAGSLLSQTELVSYEIELLSLTLPTHLLNVYRGGLITYYPYVYIELSNVCSGGLRNIISSNNKHAERAIFRCPIFDIQDTPLFIKIGGGMQNTIKFKPNDNLFFCVRLPDGSLFNTVLSERFSPEAPEPLIQITACFGMRRIV